ncbi:MAG: hypothetical protein P1P76_08810 [Anaerolineales bacterium]|nr:hypothetical protein [Anaerolineales bacterium]
MIDPCNELREKAASALKELTDASEAMAEFSVAAPYESRDEPAVVADYLKRMHQAFERERIAWEAYYEINLELLDCIRAAYQE